MDKLLEEYHKKSDEAEKLWSKYQKKQKETAKRYKNRFVVWKENNNTLTPNMTEIGYKELERYGLVYEPKNDNLFDQRSIMYNPKNYACGLCGDQPLGEVALGFAPRYATCAKHSDFLMLSRYVFKKETL